LRIFSFGGYGLALAALALVVFGAYDSYPEMHYLKFQVDVSGREVINLGSCHKRQKPQAPTPRAPIRNRQTRKVTNAKGLNRNTNRA